MIDIHSHFLFGIDDGSKNQLQTIDMLHQAEEAGITDLVATPHVNELANVGYLEQISENLKNIRKIIKNKNLNLRIHRGSEIIFDTKIIDWLDYHELLIGKEQKYVLFEVPLFIDLSKISQLIFDIQLKNIIPIFAHPERSNKIQDSPEILEAWVNQGCLMQMNAGSILGQFGKKCQSITKKLLDAGLIHLIASDAHEAKYRTYSILRKAYDELTSKYNSSYTNILFVENPNKILNGGKVKIFVTDKEKLKKRNIHYYLNKLKLYYN